MLSIYFQTKTPLKLKEPCNYTEMIGENQDCLRKIGHVIITNYPKEILSVHERRKPAETHGVKAGSKNPKAEEKEVGNHE